MRKYIRVHLPGDPEYLFLPALFCVQADKGLLDKQKTTLEGKGDVVLFLPYVADLSKSDVSALWKYPPDTPDPLKCVQPQKDFIHSHSFFGESAEG